MDDIQVVEAVQAYWPNWPKEIVVITKKLRQTFLSIYFELDQGKYLCILEISVGPRKGLQAEYLFIFDVQQPIIADRLVVWYGFDALMQLAYGYLPFDEIRQEIHQNLEGVDEICQKFLMQALGQIKAEPEEFLNFAKNRANVLGGSVKAISAGLPGQGKHQGVKKR